MKAQSLLVLTAIFFLCASLGFTQERHTIYVVGISWHSGFVIPGYALPDTIWGQPAVSHQELLQPQRHLQSEGGDAQGNLKPLLISNFSQYNYLEIGWGDRDFFQSEEFNIWYSMKAVAWPTETAIHISPLAAEKPESRYASEDIVGISLTSDQLDKLVRFLLSNLEFDQNGNVIVLGQGFNVQSRFLAGSGKYYFPRNSNVWTASGLEAAGFDITPSLCQTRDILLNKVRKLSEKVGN